MTKGGRGRQGLDRDESRGNKTSPFEGAENAENIMESATNETPTDNSPAAGMLDTRKEKNNSLEVLKLIYQDLQGIKNYLMKPNESDEEQKLRDRENELEKEKEKECCCCDDDMRDPKNKDKKPKSIWETAKGWFETAQDWFTTITVGALAWAKWGGTILAAIRGIGTFVAAVATSSGAIMAAVGLLGAAIGLGIARLALLGWDSMFDDNVGERFFELDTLTFGDVDRENERMRLIGEQTTQQYNQSNSPEFIASRLQDPRELPGLLREGKITKNQALEAVQKLNSSNSDAVDPAIIEKINNFAPTSSIEPYMLPEFGEPPSPNVSPSNEIMPTYIPNNASTGSGQSVSLQKSLVGAPLIEPYIDGLDLQPKLVTEGQFTLIPKSLLSGRDSIIIPRIGREPPPSMPTELKEWTDKNGVEYWRIPVSPEGTAPFWEFRNNDDWKPNMSKEESVKYKNRIEGVGIGNESKTTSSSIRSSNMYENTAMLSSGPSSSNSFITDTQKSMSGNSSTLLTSNQNINNNSNARSFQNTGSGSNKNQPNNISNFATTNNTQVVYNNDDLKIRNSSSIAQIMQQRIYSV